MGPLKIVNMCSYMVWKFSALVYIELGVNIYLSRNKII
jgi:hypothetical protein